MNNESISSKTEFFKLAKGKFITRTMVGGLALDEWDEWVANAKKQLQEQGVKLEDIVETERELSIKNSPQFWRKPVINRVSTGEIIERSQDYTFVSTDLPLDENGNPVKSQGKKSDLKLIDNKLVLTMFNGAELHYSIKQ